MMFFKTLLLRMYLWLWPVTYLAGLAVTVRYFRKFSRAVFVLLLIYFSLGIYSHTLSHKVEQWMARRTLDEPTLAELARYEAYSKELEELYARHFEDDSSGVVPKLPKLL